MNLIAKQLRRARKKAKLSQADLARKLDRSRSAVCEWEKGVREPSVSTLREIADVFGIDVTELVS